jgi:hypothetical protein
LPDRLAAVWSVVVNSGEDDDIAAIAQALQVVGEWNRRTDAHAPRPVVEPHSSLARDDAESAPYRVSDATWTALTHAVDHLRCAQLLLTGAGTVPIFGMATLLRAALENGSIAVWLLAPTSRDERLLRRLRLAWKNAVQAESARKLTGTEHPSDLSAQRARVVQVAARRGLPESEIFRELGFGHIVQTAAIDLIGTGTAAFAAWRACSGLTHGDTWAMRNLLEREEVYRDADVVGEHISAHTGVLRGVLGVTIATVSSAWDHFDARRAAPNFPG